MLSPLDEIDLTLPALTSSRNVGLKGTLTRGRPDGSDTSTAIQFSASSATTSHKKTGRRCGGGRPPAPPGEPPPPRGRAARPPRLSRRIRGGGFGRPAPAAPGRAVRAGRPR